jgi:hypothetical protein
LRPWLNANLSLSPALFHLSLSFPLSFLSTHRHTRTHTDTHAHVNSGDAKEIQGPLEGVLKRVLTPLRPCSFFVHLCCYCFFVEILFSMFSFGLSGKNSHMFVPPRTLSLSQNYKEFDWKMLHVFFPPACYEGQVRYPQPPPLLMMPSAMSGVACTMHSVHAWGWPHRHTLSIVPAVGMASQTHTPNTLGAK